MLTASKEDLFGSGAFCSQHSHKHQKCCPHRSATGDPCVLTWPGASPKLEVKPRVVSSARLADVPPSEPQVMPGLPRKLCLSSRGKQAAQSTLAE